MDPGPSEEHLSFLLGSLDDLERERAAGDVDDHDYAVLKDDYTARSAAVLRSIEAGTDTTQPTERRSATRVVLTGLGVLVFAAAAGLLVAQSVGRRDAGEVSSGGVRQSVTEKLNEAGRRGSTGDLEGAIGVYDEVLAEDPNNPEALTYKGWMQTLAGNGEAGLATLLEAATSTPSYPDVHAFLAIVFFRNGLVAQADRELDRLDALDPPPAVKELTANLRVQIDAALATTTTGAP